MLPLTYTSTATLLITWHVTATLIESDKPGYWVWTATPKPKS